MTWHHVTIVVLAALLALTLWVCWWAGRGLFAADPEPAAAPLPVAADWLDDSDLFNFPCAQQGPSLSPGGTSPAAPATRSAAPGWEQPARRSALPRRSLKRRGSRCHQPQEA